MQRICAEEEAVATLEAMDALERRDSHPAIRFRPHWHTPEQGPPLSARRMHALQITTMHIYELHFLVYSIAV